jgi:glycosyltransferase involved in cell wall biosynthesis
MNNIKDHISVCICTYKRPKLLARLLRKLQNQQPTNLFTYSIVVVDNDCNQSAKETVSSIQKEFSLQIDYFVEPEQNFALVRNRAVKNAKGNLIAFVDDDEFPVKDWLFNLYKAYLDFGADGVLGPVKPYFENRPPNWVIRGRLCEREHFKTGTVLHKARHTRTGNVLFEKELFDMEESLFNPEFGRTGGEDVDFFRRMIKKGHIFIWCDEAIVFESVPVERCKRSYFVRRALLRGFVNAKNSSIHSIIKSILALSIYSLALPLFLLMGQHIFMIYLIKDCDHIGKLFGLLGIKLVAERHF